MYTRFTSLCSLSIFLLLNGYCNPTCSDEFIQCQNTCFFLSNITAKWHDASYTCSELNSRSHLLVLDRKEKDQNMRKCIQNLQLDGAEIWIDGIYDIRQKHWIWGGTGSTIQYHAFSRKTFADDAEWKCIALNSMLNYKWSSRNCLSEKRLICEIKIDA